MKRFIVLALLLLVGAVAFYFVVNRSKEVAQKHPYDKLILTQQAPHWRASSCSAILGLKSAQRELKLDEQQIKKLKSIIAEQKQESSRLWKTWRKSNQKKKYTIPYEADGTKELALKTFEQCQQILTSAQSKRLRQLDLQSMGWDCVFLPDVRQRLELTPSQLREMKDLKLKEINLRNVWRQKVFTKAAQTEIQQAKSDLDAVQDQFALVLSEKQRTKRETLLGKPVDLNAPQKK